MSHISSFQMGALNDVKAMIPPKCSLLDKCVYWGYIKSMGKVLLMGAEGGQITKKTLPNLGDDS